MSSLVEPSKARPPILRGGLIAVFLWIVIQILLITFNLTNLLFGVIDGIGYVHAIWNFGWSGLDWSLWPVILVELTLPILLIAIHLWLLRKFFQRSSKFPSAFISVLTLVALHNLVLMALYQVFIGEFPPAGGTALVVALRAYQYLCNSPRAKAVFGTA